LFVERAAAVQPGFSLDRDNAAAVSEICARVDGLPLAIELAAARTRLFTPQALLARLQRRLTLLTGGARDLPVRLQTMRDAVAWSFDLLDEAERRLFRRLAVFVGGWTLETAQVVCGDPQVRPETRDQGGSESFVLGPPPLVPGPNDVLDGLTSLVDKSLLLLRHPDRPTAPADEPRFAMLATIREYALEQLG